MRRIAFLLAVVCCAVGLTAFRFAAVEAVYKVDPMMTNVVWFGKKITGIHSGTLKISEGTLTMKGDNLTSARIVFDMNTIKCSDIKDPERNQKMVDHLKDPDFFDAEKYPTAEFVMTKAKKLGKEQYAVYGNLTIKGITHPIQFPVVLTASDNQTSVMAMTGKIPVNRTAYGIKYGSASFFTSLGDKAIDDEFEVEVTQLLAKRVQ